MESRPPSPNSNFKNHEFYTFDKVLKSIPTCRHYQKSDKKRKIFLLDLSPPPDWKSSLLNELDLHLPKTSICQLQEQQKEPSDDFFNCRKSVYKQCHSVIEFSRHVAEIAEVLDPISNSLYLLVDQYPRSGNINRISSFLILLNKLIEFIPWNEFEKLTGEKVQKTLDHMLKDLKNFRRDSNQLQREAEKLGKTADKAFKHGPNTDFALVIEQGQGQGQQVASHTTGLEKKTEVKIGLTRANELLISTRMIGMIKLSGQIQLSLAIMILQHIRKMLITSTLQLEHALDLTNRMSAPKKWTQVQSTRLTAFELALLRKSNGLLTKSTAELSNLTVSLEYQAKFLYELRHPFKLLKDNLKNTSYNSIMDNHVVMFQVVVEESSLKKYIATDCLNEEATTYIIQKYTELK